MVKRSTVLLIAILAVVMALGVGFAAITSTQLNITGNTTATPDQANFNSNNRCAWVISKRRYSYSNI